MADNKYTKEILEEAVRNSFSYAGVLRYLGLVQAGGTQCHIRRKIAGYDIDTEHFTGQAHNKGKKPATRKTSEEILVRLDADVDRRVKTSHLIRALIDTDTAYECSECGIVGEYNGKPLVLHVDHIDGDFRNNLKENLRFLCPNCHSQTSTYCRKRPNNVKELFVMNIDASFQFKYSETIKELKKN